MERIAIGSDHGGVDLKAYLREELIKLGYEVTDCGTFTKDSCNYPTYAIQTATKVAIGEADLGIVICRTGEGVSISANKVKGIRCGIGYNEKVSALMKEHNNANMIALGADYLTNEEALKNVLTFINAKFLGGRHMVRVSLITDYEKAHSK